MSRGNEYLEASRALHMMLAESRHLDDCLGSAPAPLVQQICYGACRHFYFYQELTERLLDKPLPEKHLDLQMLLVAGLYSMDHLHRPAHASVNRVVDAVPLLKKNWARGMVNAVLRRYGRETEQLTKQMSDSAILNHPDWLADLIRADWPDRPEIFTCNNQQAPMTLRVNARQVSAADYIRELANRNIEAHAGQLSPEAVTLTQAVSVSELPGFEAGRVSVQDEAPQLAPSLMHLFEGARVLDACAAPGGKTCHILEAADGIELTALDRDARRALRINENLERLSLTADVITADLLSWKTRDVFDRILLDVPCSATGIIRRHPDIKLLRTREDIDKLASIQRGLLDKAFDLLGPGGELLYSTCSILKKENDQVIADFLAGTQSARLNPINAPATTSAAPTPYGLQLFPTMDAHDGFYYSSISRVAA